MACIEEKRTRTVGEGTAMWIGEGSTVKRFPDMSPKLCSEEGGGILSRDGLSRHFLFARS